MVLLRLFAIAKEIRITKLSVERDEKQKDYKLKISFTTNNITEGAEHTLYLQLFAIYIISNEKKKWRRREVVHSMLQQEGIN